MLYMIEERKPVYITGEHRRVATGTYQFNRIGKPYKNREKAINRANSLLTNNFVRVITDTKQVVHKFNLGG